MFKVKERNQKTSELLKEAKSLFKVWCYWAPEELDNNFPIPELTEREFNENIEADEEFKNMSWNDLNEKYDITDFMTFRERIILEIEYFQKTGKHLDINNCTLCSSRYSDGSVPRMRFNPHDVEVDFYDWNPDYSTDRLRARRAVSKTFNSKLLPLDKIQELKKQDCEVSPFNLTAEYRLGELRGYNQAIDDVCELLK